MVHNISGDIKIWQQKTYQCRVSSRTLHQVVISWWLFILLSCLNCFLQISHLNLHIPVCGSLYFCSVKIAYCKYHIQIIEVSVPSKSSHPGFTCRWFLIFPSCLNCFLQVLSHLNIRSTMAIISLYVVPHTSILFKLLNTNITFKFRSPMGIASIYSSWGIWHVALHTSPVLSDCCKDHIHIQTREVIR